MRDMDNQTGTAGFARRPLSLFPRRGQDESGGGLAEGTAGVKKICRRSVPRRRTPTGAQCEP